MCIIINRIIISKYSPRRTNMSTTLYHHPICPFSRQARMLLQEHQIACRFEEYQFWQKAPDLLKLNPAGELPIFVDHNNSPICGIVPIYEYINTVYPINQHLIGSNPIVSAEVRRLVQWFNEKFYREVTKPILYERVIKYYQRSVEVNSNILRIAKHNIYYHLDYINFLLNKKDWLAGHSLSIADFAAASQLSILDYLGDVPWDYNHIVKEWYAVLKSRPSFRSLLEDRILGFSPAKHYADLDF